MSRPLPFAVKEQRGTFKKNPQRRTTDEPARFGRPVKPRHLDPMASKEWGRINKLLDSMGVLSASDAPAIEQYCVVYSRWRNALDRINSGDTTPEGKTYSAAAVREAREAADMIRRYLVEFGMTPASRTTVRAETEEAGMDWFERALRNRASN